MKIFIVGSGKLANAINSANLVFPSCEVMLWENRPDGFKEKAIIVHAGSGRQLKECFEFCEITGSTFIELSTGLETEKMNPGFPLIVCPNTSMLLLKTLQIFKVFGKYFENDKITITESHQSSKTSDPGTAYSFAKALNFQVEKIKSIRDQSFQINSLGIPPEYLDKHAYHKITIKDGTDEVIVETKALGLETYVRGVKKIINAVLNHNFERKRYSVLELLDNGLI